MESNCISNKINKLSHKAFRYLLKKFRRKRKRKAMALAREELEEKEQRATEVLPHYEEFEADRRRNAALWEQFQEKENLRKNREWIRREELAQAEFRMKKKYQEGESIRRDAERKRMLAELEEKNALDVATAEKSKMDKSKKEETFQAALSELPKGDEPWHNPYNPNSQQQMVLSEKEQCSFFAKTGCCRFGDRCSRGHLYPEVSRTVLIRGMYSHFSMDQSNRDDYDTDMGLEFEDSDTYQDFKKFYEDVLPEFKLCGRVTQFKVCSNHELHLRGNVFVEFAKEQHAIEAMKKFNGRFYAGKQISCEFSGVHNWKSAICGLHVSKRCPKGNNCNFLHVFRNPDKEFWASDRNLPERSNRQEHRSHSQRSSRSNGSYRQEERIRRSPESSRSLQRRKRHHSSESDKSDEKYNSRNSKSYNEKSKKKRKHRSRSPSNDSSRRKHKKKKSKKRKRSHSSHTSDSND